MLDPLFVNCNYPGLKVITRVILFHVARLFLRFSRAMIRQVNEPRNI